MSKDKRFSPDDLPLSLVFSTCNYFGSDYKIPLYIIIINFLNCHDEFSVYNFAPYFLLLLLIVDFPVTATVLLFWGYLLFSVVCLTSISLKTFVSSQRVLFINLVNSVYFINIFKLITFNQVSSLIYQYTIVSADNFFTIVYGILVA